MLRLAALWFALAVVSHWLNVACGLPARVASLLVTAARALGLPAHATGDVVLLRGYSLRIVEECTGVSLAGAVAAFALVTPAPWQTRLRGAVLLGGVALAWNALRLLGVAWVAQMAPAHVAFVHDVLWQVATVAVLLGAAAMWTQAAPGIGLAVARGVGAAAVGVVVWWATPVAHGCATLLAAMARWGVALGTGQPTRLVELPAGGEPGLGILVAAARPGAGPIGLPLTWPHLTEVGVGLVVFVALLVAWGAWPAAARRGGWAVRSAIGAAALLVMQAIAVTFVAWGAMAGGPARLEQVGGVLESGATWVLPALAWAWVVWGGKAEATRRRLSRR